MPEDTCRELSGNDDPQPSVSFHNITRFVKRLGALSFTHMRDSFVPITHIIPRKPKWTTLRKLLRRSSFATMVFSTCKLENLRERERERESLAAILRWRLRERSAFKDMHNSVVLWRTAESTDECLLVHLHVHGAHVRTATCPQNPPLQLPARRHSLFLPRSNVVHLDSLQSSAYTDLYCDTKSNSATFLFTRLQSNRLQNCS